MKYPVLVGVLLGALCFARASSACDPQQQDCGTFCCAYNCCVNGCCDDANYPYCCPNDQCGATPDCGSLPPPPPPPPQCGPGTTNCGASHCTVLGYPVCCASVGHEELVCPANTYCVVVGSSVKCRSTSGVDTPPPTNTSMPPAPTPTPTSKPTERPFTERSALDEDPPRSCALGDATGSSGSLALFVATCALVLARRRRRPKL